MNSLLHGKQQAGRRLLKFGLSLSGHVKWLSRAKRSCYIRLSKSAGSCLIFAYDNLNAAAERFLKKLSLMTYASHARVITVNIQTNLIHLSIKMTVPHQSGAPFVGERVFQNRGVCGLSPPPPPSFQLFTLAPFFAHPEGKKTNTRGQNLVRFVPERLLRRLRLGSFL